MLYIIWALIAEIGFTSVTLLNKKLRDAGVETVSLLAIGVFALPIWISILLLMTLNSTDIVLTSSYFFYVTTWVGLCFLANFGGLFLFKFQSLSENAEVGFGLTALMAMLSDFFFFDVYFNLTKIILISLCVSGGIILSHSRRHQKHLEYHIPVHQKIFAILFLSVISTAMLITYKKGIQIQPHIFFHMALTHTLLFIVFGFLGWKKLLSHMSKNTFRKEFILAIICLGTIAAITSSYAIGALPLAFIVLFSLIRACTYAGYDLYTREIELNKMTAFALFIIITSMIGIAFVHGAS